MSQHQLNEKLIEILRRYHVKIYDVVALGTQSYLLQTDIPAPESLKEEIRKAVGAYFVMKFATLPKALQLPLPTFSPMRHYG